MGTRLTSHTGEEQPHCKSEQTHSRGTAFIDEHTCKNVHMHPVTNTCASVIKGTHRNTVLASGKAVVVKDTRYKKSVKTCRNL